MCTAFPLDPNGLQIEHRQQGDQQCKHCICLNQNGHCDCLAVLIGLLSHHADAGAAVRPGQWRKTGRQWQSAGKRLDTSGRALWSILPDCHPAGRFGLKPARRSKGRKGPVCRAKAATAEACRTCGILCDHACGRLTCDSNAFCRADTCHQSGQNRTQNCKCYT